MLSPSLNFTATFWPLAFDLPRTDAAFAQHLLLPPTHLAKEVIARQAVVRDGLPDARDYASCLLLPQRIRLGFEFFDLQLNLRAVLANRISWGWRLLCPTWATDETAVDADRERRLRLYPPIGDATQAAHRAHAAEHEVLGSVLRRCWLLAHLIVDVPVRLPSLWGLRPFSGYGAGF